MKALIFIGLLQIALLLAIFGKIVLSEDTPAEQRSSEPRRTPGLVVPSFERQTATNEPASFDEQLLRDIIRDELAAFSRNWSGGGQMAAVEEVYDPVVEAEREARRHDVEQQIEYYSSVGAISTAEMQRLKSEIARLDPDSRIAMMQKLVRALNTGAIDGRL